MATSPGSYKGVTINPGTDAEVSAQIAAIDKGGTTSGNFTTPSGAVVNSAGSLISPPVAPTNAGNVNRTGDVQLPTGTPATGSTSGVGALTDYYKSLFDTATQQAKDAQTQRDAALAQQKEQTKGFLDNLMNAKSPSQTRTDAQASTGIDPNTYFAEEKAKIAEIGKLNEEYNATVQAKDQQIAALTGQGRGLTIDFLNNQAAQIERNAAPKLNAMSANINSKAAVLQASQGMFSEAQKYVDQAVNDATADLKFNADMFKTFYDTNQNVIDGLDTKYKDALKTATDTAEKAYTASLNEKKSVGQLMIDNPQANISISDSLEEAYGKVQASGVGTNKDIQLVESSGGVFTYNKKTGEFKTLREPTAPGTSSLDILRQLQIDALTQTSPGQVVNAATGQPAKLTAAQTEDFQRYDQYTNNLIPLARSLLDTNSPDHVNTGGAVGTYMKTAQNIPGVQKLLSENQNKLLSTVATRQNQLIYMLSGKQINESEYNRLKAQLPDVTLTNAQNILRIEEFNKLMQQAKSDKLKLQGLTVKGEGSSSGTSGKTSSGISWTVTP